MNPLLLIIILMLLFGGGGFYIGGPGYGGGGVGLVLLICLVVFLFGGFRTKNSPLRGPAPPTLLRSARIGHAEFQVAGPTRGVGFFV